MRTCAAWTRARGSVGHDGAAGLGLACILAAPAYRQLLLSGSDAAAPLSPNPPPVSRPPPTPDGLPCFGGGDVRIAHCLWRFGFGPTLPRARPGRPDLEGCVFGRMGSALDVLVTLDGYLKGDSPCDGDCRDALENTVTTNIDHKVIRCLLG